MFCQRQHQNLEKNGVVRREMQFSEGFLWLAAAASTETPEVLGCSWFRLH
jgi:hypothetical protein